MLAAPAAAFKACQVTDLGGVDDKSFNQTAWKGVEDMIAAGYATEDSDYLESQADTDYAPNIQAWLDKGCDLIITVGFLLGDATADAANANPDQPFQII
jgi:basic membrane protein A